MLLEHENLRRALEWSLSSDAVAGLHLANELGHFWRELGHLHEGRRWLEAALAAASDAPLLLRARAAGNDGVMALALGDVEAAWVRLNHALALAREVGSQDSDGRLLTGSLLPAVGSAAFGLGELEAAQSLFEEAVVVNRDIGHRWNENAARLGLGKVAMAKGDFSAASSLFNEALRNLRQLGVDSEAAECQTFLGRLHLFEQEYGAAERFLNDAIQVHRVMGRKRLLAVSLGILGELRLQLGRANEARAFFDEELSIAREIGLQDCEAEALRGLERSSQPVTSPGAGPS